jgi:hypothetical protein
MNVLSFVKFVFLSLGVLLLAACGPQIKTSVEQVSSKPPYVTIHVMHAYHSHGSTATPECIIYEVDEGNIVYYNSGVSFTDRKTGKRIVTSNYIIFYN